MWALLSLIAGIGDALRDTATKRFAAGTPYILVAWSLTLFSTPYFIPLFFKYKPEILPPNFWPLLLAIASLHLIGGIVLVRTLSAGELSLSMPLSAFTPVFLLFQAPFITGDPVTTVGVVGSLLVVLGSYMLNISQAKNDLLAPIKALVHQPAARGMLFLSYLWSLTGSIDRIALKSIPLEFWASAQLLATAVLFFPIVLRSGELPKLFRRDTFGKLALIGALAAFSFYPYLYALKVAPAHFVICVKRSGIFFSMLIGKFYFNEHHLQERLLGALIMIIGVVVISVF